MLVIVWLAVQVNGSATHNHRVLQHYILANELSIAYAGLWPAAKKGSADAMSALVRLSAHYKDEHWLKKAASVNHLPAILALVTQAETAKDRITWWRRAARLQHAPSQFELALVEVDPQKRLGYLSQSAELDHQPAIIAFAKYWYDSGSVDKAITWLKKAANVDALSAFKLARLLWQQQQYVQASEYFEQAAQTLPEAKRYLTTIKNKPSTEILALSNPLNVTLKAQCAQQLQFVATSLNSAVQAQAFAERFKNDERFSDVNICLNPITWFTADALHCEQYQFRQQCDFTSLATTTFEPNYTHLVLFLPTGTAYVHKGIMYLDQADTYSVFVHELAHLVGFVDEYAVGSELASQYCYEGEAPNLVLDDNRATSPQYQQWLAFNQAQSLQGMSNDTSPYDSTVHSLQVAPSRTCNKLNIKTLKPASKITFLEHHDTEYIPPLYLTLWAHNLQQTYQNIAVAEHFYWHAVEHELLTANHWQQLYR
ncbi:MAG: hypothetical protein WA981_10460 [Glaciecola sp.]